MSNPNDPPRPVVAPVVEEYRPWLTQDYGPDHEGLDIAAKIGTPISASLVGQVVLASIVNAGQIDPRTRASNLVIEDASKNYGYGNTLVVEYGFDEQFPEIQWQLTQAYGMRSGESLYALYAHLDSIGRASGLVLPGDTIATVGTDGRSTGPHLHLDFKVGASGSVAAASGFGTEGWKGLGRRVNPNDLANIRPTRVNALTPALVERLLADFNMLGSELIG